MNIWIFDIIFGLGLSHVAMWRFGYHKGWMKACDEFASQSLTKDEERK